MPPVPPVALVTGSAAASASMAALLRARAYQVALGTEPGALPEVEGVTCYVQLPWSAEGARPDVLRDGLAGRLDLLAAIAPCLSPRATVLLGLAEEAPEGSGASAELLQAIAMVLLEDMGCQARVVALPADALCRTETALVGLTA